MALYPNIDLFTLGDQRDKEQGNTGKGSGLYNPESQSPGCVYGDCKHDSRRKYARAWIDGRYIMHNSSFSLNVSKSNGVAIQFNCEVLSKYVYVIHGVTSIYGT